jgi:glycosyltransferase involved in cell wall biosynthesis
MELDSGLMISVVIPLHNKELFVQRAIRSVLAQTYSHFELLIIDDGSTDNSYTVASEIHDSRLRIIHQENKGVSSARNSGVVEAKNEWIAFLDADDLWLPTFLEKMVFLMQAYPKCGIYGSGYELVYPDGSKEWPWNRLFPPNWSGIVKNYLHSINHGRSPFCSSSVLVNKALLTAIGGFPLGINYGEDLDTWIRASAITQIAFLSQPLVHYFKETSNSASDHSDYEVEFYPAKRLRELLKNKINDLDRKAAIEFISRSELNTARALIKIGKPFQATRFIWEARKTKSQKMRLLHIIIKEWIPSIFS